MWAGADGGFAPERWLPGALLVLGLLAVTLASGVARARLRAGAAAPLLLGLYVVWSYASVAWARAPGDALDGANRTLLYACVFALFTALPLGARARVGFAWLWSAGVAAVGIAALVGAAAATRPEGHFVLGRLASPISYPNADAALFLSAAVTLAVQASGRESAVLLRAVSAAVAATLVDLAVLCQSRGSVVAAALTVLLLAFGRSGLRRLVLVLVVAAAVAPAVPALLAVLPAVVAGASWQAATANAVRWVGVSALLAAAGAVGAAALDRRLTVAPRVHARARFGLVAVAGAAVLAGAAAAGHPVGRLEHGWRDFTGNVNASQTAGHLTSGVGTSRYDVWRVAVEQFASHPLTGVGADNFLAGYLRARHTDEVARYPESVELRAFSETGAVGGLLLLGFFGIALRRALAAARGAGGGVAVVCLAAPVYWLAHASIDWFWEFPALTAPAMALLALAGAPRGPVEGGAGTRRLAVAATGVCWLAAAMTLALPWIAAREVDAALGLGPGRRAYALLASAARLDPWSEQPALTEAALAARGGDRPRERRALFEALRRNPDDWYPHFMLGIVAGAEHRPAVARRELARAHLMSPRDLVVVYAQRRLRWGQPLTEREVSAIFREVNSTLSGARQRE